MSLLRVELEKVKTSQSGSMVIRLGSKDGICTGFHVITKDEFEAIEKILLPENPFQCVRDLGSRFYPDEAFTDGQDLKAIELDERHPNASYCDACPNPAEYMTFVHEDKDDIEGDAVYCCSACAKKYQVEDLIDA